MALVSLTNDVDKGTNIMILGDPSVRSEFLFVSVFVRILV